MKTQKVIFAFTLLFISYLHVSAQLKFGLKAGFNASNVSFENVTKRSEKYGYHVGGFAVIPISKNFMSLQPELSFSRKGGSFENLNLRRTLRMNYVDLLVPVSFQFAEIDVQVGPFASVLAGKPSYKISKESPISADGFKAFDAGLSAGLNYNFEHSFIGLRYNQGFIDITDKTSRPSLGSGKTATGQVSLGYRF
jgi:Outer membrane protein beta-barrel domain